MTDRDNFSDKKLALLPNSFWKSHHFIMRWHFSLDVLCVKEHEHWYSGISSEFIMHNTRVIGLQIASKETWKRSRYSASLVWLAMWNVHGRTQRKKCSVGHWKFLKPRLHYTRRDATWRDATRRDMTRHSSFVHTMRDIVARRHVAAGDLGSGANKIM